MLSLIRRRPGTLRALAALATALAGVVSLVSSLSPDAPARARLLERLEPGSAQSVAHGLGVLGGLVLIRLALGLLQGRCRAGRAAVAVLAVLVVVHAAKGLDYEEAGIVLVLALLLGPALRTLRDGLDPSRALVAALSLVIVISASYAVALGLLLVTGRSPGLGRAVLQATVAIIAGALPGGPAADVRSVIAAGTVLAAIVCCRVLLAPSHVRDGHAPAEHARAAAIVAAYGRDSIAPFALRADKSFFFSHGGLLAYRVLRETAIVAGDPICPDGLAGEILRDFVAFASGHGWSVVLLGARDDNLPQYAALGLRTMQVGLEAVVRPRGFALEAPAAKVVRKAVRRVAREGWTVDVVPARDLTPALVASVLAVERAWRAASRGRLHGFAWAGDRLWGAPEDADDLYVVARSPGGELRAFQRYVPYRGGLSLDAMRRLDDRPNGISDALVAAALEHARDRGCTEVSLNFATFAHVMAVETVARRSHRAARVGLRLLHGRFQLERLARFAAKFGPDWRARHLVFTSRTILPLAALRIAQAEAYVRPLRCRLRQDAWRPRALPVGSVRPGPRR
jgi:lysyl-tRNA synthetase, class II